MIPLFNKSELGGCMFLYHLDVTEREREKDLHLTFKFYDIQKTTLVIIDFLQLIRVPTLIKLVIMFWIIKSRHWNHSVQVELGSARHFVYI